MNEQDKRHRIARAQTVLRDIHHIPLATVNQDGSPHSSPVFLVFDKDLRGFWASSQGSLHSQNIARDPRVFLSIFDSREGHSGLFLSGRATILTDHAAAQEGLERLQELKGAVYGSMGDLSDYLIPSAQRIYAFVPERAWVNHSEKRQGVVVSDQRYEIALSELLASDRDAG
jgi:general stress protein 26